MVLHEMNFSSIISLPLDLSLKFRILVYNVEHFEINQLIRTGSPQRQLLLGFSRTFLDNSSP